MNHLTIDKRAQIISLLVEGLSMRAVSRVVDVSINTVTKLLKDVGSACSTYQDETIRGLRCKRVQCDEIWSFCYSKDKNVVPENKGVLGFGNVYTWTGMDADSKLMISYMVGKRDAYHANAFITDLASRLTSRVQISTDGHKPYLEAVEGAFGVDVDYSMLVRHYGPACVTDQSLYSPSEFSGAEKCVIVGKPDMEMASASSVERQNLTMRIGTRRFTSVTNGFNKKLENLEHAVSLHFMHYNFARIHKTLRVTLAMEAGISDHVWSIEEIAAMIPSPIAAKHAVYKPRQVTISN